MLFENQKMLESFFNERQTPILIRHELLANEKVRELVDRSELPQDFAMDLLGQMILVKRATVPQLIGVLKRHFVDQINPWQACADALEQACRADLMDWSVPDQRFVLRFDVDAPTHALIRQYQYLPPMVVPPLKVTENRGSGYLSIQTDSLILRDNHHEGDLGLDSLNRFNQIPLALNTTVATQVANTWKNLDRQKEDETWDEYKKRLAAFDRYQKDTAFTMALMVEMGNRFYLTHKLDKRGRTYCQGYHINYQGNCWNKAVIELADKEPIQE